MSPKKVACIAIVAITIAGCSGSASSSSSTETATQASATANAVAINLPSVDSMTLCSTAFTKGEQEELGVRSAKPHLANDSASCYYLMSDDGKAGYIVSVFSDADALTRGVDTTVWPQKPEPLIFEGLPAVRQAAYSGDKWQSEIVMAANAGKFLSVTHYTLPNSVAASDLNEKASRAAKTVLHNFGENNEVFPALRKLT